VRVIYEGLEGHSSPDRDLAIDAMNEVARRLTAKYPIQVSAVRYREGRHELEGFLVWRNPGERGGDTEWLGSNGLVPVRRRLRLGRLRWRWTEVQPVPDAAADIGRAARA
jgi:hypothetical protein